MSSGAAALAAFSISAGTAYALGESMKPEVPDVPEPEPMVEKGDEGIRKGTMRRLEKKSSQRKLLATRGSRADDATLGGYMQTLGG